MNPKYEFIIETKYMTTRKKRDGKVEPNLEIEKNEQLEAIQRDSATSDIPDQLFAFLLASVNDIQTTIKAIDTKVGFLLVFLGLPIGGLGKIFNVLYGLFSQVNSNNKWIVVVFIAIFALSWLVSFILALMALVSISNPRKHIKSPPENGGAYFQGGLFDFKFYDVINRNWFGGKGPTSNCSLEDVIKNLPYEKSKIIEELAFEQMKLAYIRDIKIKRQNFAYLITLIWIFLGFIGWMSFLVFSKWQS